MSKTIEEQQKYLEDLEEINNIHPGLCNILIKLYEKIYFLEKKLNSMGIKNRNDNQ